MLEYAVIIFFSYLILVCANGLRETGNIKWLYYGCQMLIFALCTIACFSISASKEANQTIKDLRNMPECYEITVD